MLNLSIFAASWKAFIVPWDAEMLPWVHHEVKAPATDEDAYERLDLFQRAIVDRVLLIKQQLDQPQIDGVAFVRGQFSRRMVDSRGVDYAERMWAEVWDDLCVSPVEIPLDNLTLRRRSIARAYYMWNVDKAAVGALVAGVLAGFADEEVTLKVRGERTASDRQAIVTRKVALNQVRGSLTKFASGEKLTQDDVTPAMVANFLMVAELDASDESLNGELRKLELMRKQLRDLSAQVARTFDTPHAVSELEKRIDQLTSRGNE